MNTLRALLILLAGTTASAQNPHWLEDSRVWGLPIALNALAILLIGLSGATVLGAIHALLF